MTISQLENLHFPFYDVKDQLKRVVYEQSRQAFAAGDRARDAILTKDHLVRRQQYVRETFDASIGGIPYTDAPLHAASTGIETEGSYSIEKIVFQSRPHVYVTGNLYIPHSVADSHAATGSTHAAVLFLSGHNSEAKHSKRYHTVCQYLVRAGLIVFAMDPLGQGERFHYRSGEHRLLTESYEHEHPGTQCWPLGDSLARYFVHDAMRAVDYMCTRLEIDPERIGVTGSSGGGTQTAMLMMADPRIAAAAPGTYITSRESYLYAGQPQDAEQIWPGFSAAGLDHEDMLLAMAPRPVAILAVNYDIFPIEGTRRTVTRTKRFWDMYGCADRLELIEDPHVHMYTDKLAQSAARFFTSHLMQRSGEPEVSCIRAVPTSRLLCTPAGQVMHSYPDARSIHDELVTRSQELARQRARQSDEERKASSREWLLEQIVRGRRFCDPNTRHLSHFQLDEMRVFQLLWWSQEGIMNHGYLFRRHDRMRDTLPATVAVWSGGTTALRPHLDWIRSACAAGRAVFLVDLSGVGLLEPYPFYKGDAREPYGALSKLTTDLLFLGDSLAAMRLHDLRRAVDVLCELPSIDANGLHLYSYGRYNVYTELIGWLDDRVRQIRMDNPLHSLSQFVESEYYDQYDAMGLLLPGLLRHADLPDIRRWANDLYNYSGQE
jgi:cephalosporin-C deacetylase-like acetyl esterase